MTPGEKETLESASKRIRLYAIRKEADKLAKIKERNEFL